MDCVFCRIVAGEIPADILHQDEEVIAFRDINPVAPDAETPLIGHMAKIANHLAKEEGIFESGYRLAISCGEQGGQEVPHLHMHLVGGRQLAPTLG